MNPIRPVALTPQELRVFELLMEYDELDAKLLAELQQISVQTARQLLHALQNKGYVCRARVGLRKLYYTANADKVREYKNPLKVPNLEQVLQEK